MSIVNNYTITPHPYHFFNGKYIAVINGVRHDMTRKQAQECVEFVEEERAAGRTLEPEIAAKYIAAVMILEWAQ